ncbi:MAG: hypothetical protein PXZ07_00050 [Candidatus Eremiobacteraeota bacterium]|nr:hypothetical protein [Candidatus Eremiobacteraeota bacterium]
MDYQPLQWYFFIICVLLIIVNAAASLMYQHRGLAFTLFEVFVSTLLLVLVLNYWSPLHRQDNPYILPEALVVALAAGASAKVGFAKKMFRATGIDEKLGNIGWKFFGDRVAKRVDLAKTRMAAREARAKEMGISVIDVLKLEHDEEKRRGN